MFNYGRPGTGKSTAAVFARSLHDTELLSSSSTYASIRNLIKTSRYLIPDEEDEETDGAMLCFDNVNPSTFQDEDVRNLMLMGYKRTTDRVAHAGAQGGGNVYFRCFSSKIFSSIHPIHTQHELAELFRRMLIIFHEKATDFDGEMLDLEDVDWEDFYTDIYWRFHQNKSNALMFAKAWKAAKTHVYSDACWSPARKSLVRDLLATGVAIGSWSTVKEGIKTFTEYWHYFDEKVTNNRVDLDQFLEQWSEGKKFIMHPELENQIDKLVNEKRLLKSKSKYDIGGIMGSLGYTKELDVWSKA